MEQSVVHQLHAKLRTRLHCTVDSEGLIFSNQVCNARCHIENLVGSASTTAHFWKQRLCYHANQRTGELCTNLILQVTGESINDSVDGTLSTVGMKCAENNVTRFSSTNRSLDRFKVTKLTDQNDIGVLPQCSPNRFGEAWHIDADLSLVDRAFDVIVIKLDRILDRNDVMINGFVEQIDQARQGCTLARPRWPRDQEQSARAMNQLHNGLRQPELLGSQFIVGNLTQHHRNESALLENRNAKSSCITKCKTKVGATRLLKLPLTTLGRDALHQPDTILGFKCFCLQLPHSTMQTKHRRLPHDNMNIAGALLDCSLQKLIDKNSCQGSAPKYGFRVEGNQLN